MHARTKDETFMVRLYEEALKQPDIETPFNCYEIGALVGMQPRGVNATCILLKRTNFIIKKDDLISITPHGINLVKKILENHEK